MTCYPHVSRHVSINCPTNYHPICSQHVPNMFPYVPTSFPSFFLITCLPDFTHSFTRCSKNSSGLSHFFQRFSHFFQRFHPPNGIAIASRSGGGRPSRRRGHCLRTLETWSLWRKVGKMIGK